jgi:hypothetical protein
MFEGVTNQSHLQIHEADSNPLNSLQICEAGDSAADRDVCGEGGGHGHYRQAVCARHAGPHPGGLCAQRAARNVPDARGSEVLSLFAAIINK